MYFAAPFNVRNGSKADIRLEAFPTNISPYFNRALPRRMASDVTISAEHCASNSQ